MVLPKLMATLATAVLFGSGAAAAAALADAPPTTTEPTTSAPTTTATTTTTTTEATTTSTETTTTPAETTTAPPTSTTTASSQPRRATPTPARPHEASVSDAPPGKVRPAHRRKHRRRISRPLKVTPLLGQGNYVFPVVGSAGYGDSYGAFRGDVHGKWHHGDDIFAALGAPVVAVANGTINRVGWHKRGGWRLWVRDAAANQFYYAHLSGYAPRVFHTRHVRAGDVLGFVGNTGDAIASPPHLHFEVHPHQLLRLRYDGAVNPTTYLNSWPHMRSVHAPFPVHPQLPTHARFRTEARQVFRRLLLARHLIEQPATPIEQPEVDRPARRGAPSTTRLASREEPAMPMVSAGSATPTVPLLAGLLVLTIFVAAPLLAAMVLGRILRNSVSEAS